MADTLAAPVRAAERPPDPAGLRPHRLRWLTQPWRLVLADDEEVVVRGARQSDVDAIALMHGRSSAATTAARHGAGAGRLSRSALRRLVGTDLALVAVAGHARIVALANLAPCDPETAEIAVIVEDAYQHRGIGTALVRQITGGARLVGYRRVHVETTPQAEWARSLLRTPGISTVESDGARGATLRLGPGVLAALTGPGALVRAAAPI